MNKNRNPANQNQTVLNANSPFLKEFDFSHIKCLIVCRGPIRKEALDVFAELGCMPSGILLSKKDSIVYRLALAPELRLLDRNKSVHRIDDYMAAGSKEDKEKHIQEIIQICIDHSYTHIFAGYGFMAEDEEFVAAIEKTQICFIGPRSSVMAKAGAKDEAKKLARSLGLAVTPGIDNISSLTLAAKVSYNFENFKKLFTEKKFTLSENELQIEFDRITKQSSSKTETELPQSNPNNQNIIEKNKNIFLELCTLILSKSYEQHIDLISIDELAAQAEIEIQNILSKNPSYRIRLKYIGGGGGKGQRIISDAKDTKNAVLEVLNESKVTGVGDNKNFLIELNIEKTRHNEIQLLGNGKWCIALGGRDCSLQMHEQKLVEISLSTELFETELTFAKKNNSPLATINSLEKNLSSLEKMQSEAVLFAKAVGLNSASTFECIVDENSHYFMEMNTRIQVEHRVSEMVYSLKFRNPENENDFFIVQSLVAAMLFTACYPEKLPEPELIPRNTSSMEIRLNASNDALQPHAGGILSYWSNPLEFEIRDDQGISVCNPDTNRFIKYQLAGAYDSNIALSVCYANNRKENFSRMAKILSSMKIIGIDVETNLAFQTGIVNWFLGQGVMATPNTLFVSSYLNAVALVKKQINLFDADYAFHVLTNSFNGADEINKQASTVLKKKYNLIMRPVKILLNSPHLLAGWLGLSYNHIFKLDDKGKTIWLKNPVSVLDNLYSYLNLNNTNTSPGWCIWVEDEKILQEGREFYRELEARDINYLEKFKSNKILEGSSPEMMIVLLGSHNAYTIGLEILEALIKLGQQSSFLNLKVNDDLSIFIPEIFSGILDKEKQNENIALLAPKEEGSSNEICSWTGGTFYSCESPGAPALILEGEHFEKGQVLGIMEVMKMFNKITAPFSGTLQKVTVDGMQGKVVAKGQILFEVSPDVYIEEEKPEQLKEERESFTSSLMKQILSKSNDGN